MATIKIARVRVSTHILQDLITGQFNRLPARSTAPEDLEVLGVEQPPFAVGVWFYIVCRSDTFRPIPEGGEIPEIPPFVFTRDPEEKQGGDHA